MKDTERDLVIKVGTIMIYFGESFLLYLATLMQIILFNRLSGLPQLLFIISTISIQSIILLQFVYYYTGKQTRYYQAVLLYVVLNSIIYGIMIYLRYFGHANIEFDDKIYTTINSTMLTSSVVAILFIARNNRGKNHTENNSFEDDKINNSPPTGLLYSYGMMIYVLFIKIITSNLL